MRRSEQLIGLGWWRRASARLPYVGGELCSANDTGRVTAAHSSCRRRLPHHTTYTAPLVNDKFLRVAVSY